MGENWFRRVREIWTRDVVDRVSELARRSRWVGGWTYSPSSTFKSAPQSPFLHTALARPITLRTAPSRLASHGHVALIGDAVPLKGLQLLSVPFRQPSFSRSSAHPPDSGINPATLSGAIDVIVVRHVDSEGQVTLASTPFHVRFGKLQVLRAAEKRVTIKMPNNLPSPHTVPFSMKVGETGEAFFVLETTDDVPEELLTSPVVMPTDVSDMWWMPLIIQADDLPPAPPPQPERPSTPRRDTAGLVTREPFGETEKIVQHDTHDGELGEVDFLDLNAQGKERRCRSSTDGETVSPSSLLSPAPTVSPVRYVRSGSDPSSSTSRSADPSKAPSSTSSRVPPNPVEAKPGQPSNMPARDHKLADVMRTADSDAPTKGQDDAATDALPKVQPGQADGPAVHYGSDVVLDMAGYHNRTDDVSGDFSADGIERSSMRSSVIDSFTRDLLAAISDVSIAPTRPTLSHHVQTDPAIQHTTTPGVLYDREDATSAFELAMSDQDDEEEERHFDRGQSEPPPDVNRTPRPLSRPLHGTAMGPPVGASPRAVMDYAWDLGTLPRIPSHPDDVDEYEGAMERSNSGPIPVASLELDSTPSKIDIRQVEKETSANRLGHVDQNPYIFTLSGSSGTPHAFEMALCGSETFAKDGRATVSS